MSAIAMALPAHFAGFASPYLSHELMAARERAPRGPLEPWCARTKAKLDRALAADSGADVSDLAHCFAETSKIALLLGRPRDASSLAAAAVSFLSGKGPAAEGLALWAILEMGRAERAEGHFDEALLRFERLAALPLGGFIEEGPFSFGPADVPSLRDFAPSLLPRLADAAIAEAIETLLLAERHDVALAVAKARGPADPPWLLAFRREATATSLGAMGLIAEALVFLASAAAREPAVTRPIFEQKRAEALAASGQLDAARARSVFVAEGLSARWDERPATLDELVIAARACRLLSMLGHDESGKLAARARPLARALGDVPLEAELSLRVLENEGPSEARAGALLSLSCIAVESGHPLAALPGAPLCRAPSYPALCDRLLSVARRSA